MKQLLIFLFILSATAGYGQQLRFKKTYKSGSHKTLSFKTDLVKGSFKGSNESMILTLKNTSKKPIDLGAVQLALVDVTGRGAKLCGHTKMIKPGQKTTLYLKVCNGKDGLFFLNKAYGSKQAFKEDAFFLINKEWRLTIGQEVILFYTDL